MGAQDNKWGRELISGARDNKWGCEIISGVPDKFNLGREIISGVVR